MTNLTKVVKRVSSAVRHEKSRTRRIIISVEPPAIVGVRLEGTRNTYRLDARALYELAIQAHVRDIEREARRIAKADKLPARTARKRAEMALKERLR